jgi:hypothetical protein
MAQHVEMVAVGDRQRAQVQRARAQLARNQFRQQAGGSGRAQHGSQLLAGGGVRRDPGPVGQVGAGLQDDELRGRQRQQKAMRLDAAGRADRFLVAGGKVEGGDHGNGLGHRAQPSCKTGKTEPFFNVKWRLE